jgi:hypothetical protein
MMRSHHATQTAERLRDADIVRLNKVEPSRELLRPRALTLPEASTRQRRRAGRAQPLACFFSFFAARFSSRVLVGFFFSSFFRSIPLPMIHSSFDQIQRQFFALRRLSIFRSVCRPDESLGGLGGFSLTRLIRSSRPTTRTFCKSLNICFGMPSGKSTKL